jgi:hypothetical protein
VWCNSTAEALGEQQQTEWMACSAAPAVVCVVHSRRGGKAVLLCVLHGVGLWLRAVMAGAQGRLGDRQCGSVGGSLATPLPRWRNAPSHPGQDQAHTFSQPGSPT